MNPLAGPSRPQDPTPPTEAALARLYRAADDWIRARIASLLPARSRMPPELAVAVDFEFHPGAPPSRAAEERFVRAVEAKLAEAAAKLGSAPLGFEQGHVYCHWCRAPVCEHSRPAEPRAVFTGYDPTGKPLWGDFASWLLAHKDPRVARLFEEGAEPLAVHKQGAMLVRDLLADFGKRYTPYHIVGQLACGYFPLPPSVAGAERRIALTIQLIESHPAPGDAAYHLNVIAGSIAPDALTALVEGRQVSVLSRFLRGLRAETRKLDHDLLESRRGGARPPARKFRARAARVLEDAPAQFEKLLRQRGRRTRHAELRSLDPDRPTGSAVADALAARDADFFFDGKEGTVIVRGRRNRIHVFRGDGAHVTSVVYAAETIRGRIRSRRWAPLDPLKIDDLRGRFGGRASGRG